MAGSTPVYGFPYPEATDLVADYPALGQELAEDIEAALPTVGGLAPATPTSIANSGGSASLSGNTVTFTGVSSVSLNGCFSGDYDNYRVLVTGASSAVAVMQIRMRVAGSDNTTASSYVSQRTISNSTTVSGARQTQDYLYSCIWSGNDYNQMALDVSRPYLSAPTLFTGLVVNGQGAPDALVLAAGHNQSSSYDGLTIYPSSGTITGTVSVYGYKS